MFEALWIDKYRPKSLKDLNYHPEITETLRDLANTNDFPVHESLLSISFFMVLKGQEKKQEW